METTTYKQQKQIIVGLFLVFFTLVAFRLITLPITVHAEDNLGLSIEEIEEIEAMTNEMLEQKAQVEIVEYENTGDLVKDTQNFNDQIRAIANNINSKRPEIEALSDNIKQSVNPETIQNTDLIPEELFDGITVKGVTNAAVSLLNGEELHLETKGLNTIAELTGLKESNSLFTQYGSLIVQTMFGIALVLFLFSLHAYVSKREV